MFELIVATNNTSAEIAVVPPIVLTRPTLLPAIEVMIMPAMPATNTTEQMMRILRNAGDELCDDFFTLLLARQWFVFDAFWLIGRDAEFFFAPCLVVGEVAFKPTHLAVALESQNMGRDSV